LDLRFDFKNVLENQISNHLNHFFQKATKQVINSMKSSKIPQIYLFFTELFFNIFRIIILVDKRAKKTRIICHCVNRFDLILILNHFKNNDLIAILNHMFGK
jgi:hypothetical protein